MRLGQWEKGIEKLMPTAVGPMMKGYREYDEGITDKNYSPVFYGTDQLKGTPLDMAARFFSFNPERIASIRQVQWREDQVRLDYQKRRSEILERFNHALVSNKSSNMDFADLYHEVMDYNTRVAGTDPKYGVPYITSKWLVSNIKRAQAPSKQEKLRAGLQTAEK